MVKNEFFLIKYQFTVDTDLAEGPNPQIRSLNAGCSLEIGDYNDHVAYSTYRSTVFTVYVQIQKI